jgi:hypothetical protein
MKLFQYVHLRVLWTAFFSISEKVDLRDRSRYMRVTPMLLRVAL